MGYVLAFSSCLVCKQVFGYNPSRVPSVRVEGKREPVCKSCIERANPLRKARGLPEIIPHPDAYEPQDENGIQWN